MSVTVSDLLNLPSLRRARVIAGQGGLTKIVSSVSVLESTDQGVLVDEVFPKELAHHNHLETACKIWPGKVCFTLPEINFASRCQKIIEGGESVLKDALRSLEPLRESRESAVLQQTLEVYLLDANCSTSRCAELLFLHKNTVKYRLNRIKEQFGHPLDKLPEVFPLYYAAALMRITNN